MNIRVSGKQVEIGDALPEQARIRVESAVGKHFDGGAEAHIVFSHEGVGFRCDCTAHFDSGVVLKAQGAGNDAYRSLDDMLEHLEKQIRRYKRRLKNHHEKPATRRTADS